MIRIAIVEDEETERKRLEAAFRKYTEESGAQFTLYCFEDAVSFLDHYESIYDIVFMDILLPKLNGMDAAQKLREIDANVLLLFVTNMANYAVRGYEVSAIDFIVKPIRYQSFRSKMDRIVDIVRHRSKEIMITFDDSRKVLPISSIYYVEVDGHTLIYHTEQGNYHSRNSLKNAEEELSGGAFVRCNVCYLVNLSFVTSVQGDDVEVGGSKLKISRARKKEFLTALANHFGRSK
ncbi:MAG: response regulator transcription factor [Clostridia bacterium]|nr:response regulator transcription factor [Clostridia bacterium]